MRVSLALAAVLPMLVVAGCLQPPAPASLNLEAMPHSHAGDMPASFSFSATDCEEGGFVAAYSGEQTYPGGWKSADIYEEVGKPAHDGIGLPVVPGTHLSGNWHMGFRCASATHDGQVVKDFVFGRVGQMIEAPDWDPGGADLHFISTGFALGNGSIADSLREVTAADISHAYNTYTEWYVPKELPRSAAYSVFCDYEKGIYETWSDMQFYRNVGARTIRFWWTVPADGSESQIAHDHGTGVGGGGAPPASDKEEKWNPVYWDLTTTGGPEYTTPPTGGEIGFHNKLSGEHGAFLTQPMLSIVYEHKAIAFTYGQVFPDVIIDELWTH